MKGTLEEGLPSDSRTRQNGSLRTRVKVLVSTALRSPTEAMSCWPSASRAAQRLIEAMQSSDVTGWPSCHSSPSRRVKVQVSLSGETVYLSTIWGWWRGGRVWGEGGG